MSSVTDHESVTPSAEDEKPRWFMGRESAAMLALFGLALIGHFGLVTYNWHAGFLSGHEFRQTHTALISHYIEEEDNFSPRYSVPIFGKPWSVPMEFPLYEWSVVLLSRVTHWPHHQSARTVSLACFYLTLPAVWVLLGRLGQAKPRRLLLLALILTCPVYIFYSRAFLMESMALMFSAWFLAMFVRAMQERRLRWLMLCAITGAGAGLVKSTTFLVWLMPAALFGAWCWWREARGRAGWNSVWKTIGWGLGAVAVPGITVYWWVKFTDTIKAPHPSAHIFTSRELTTGNFGMYSLEAHFSPHTWRMLLERWQEAILWPWLVGAVLAAGLVLGRGQRGRILIMAGLFLAAQWLFPYAYALQEYYFYACAIFLLGALGFALEEVLDAGWPAWVRWTLVAVLPVALLANYRRNYFDLQAVRSPGGTGLTDALKAYTPKGSVIIVAGDDWAPMIPYYSQRRALMIRRGLEPNQTYVERAFNDLADENVSALILARDARRDADLVRLAAAKFNLDTSTTFSHPLGDVYLSDFCRENVLSRFPSDHFDQVTSQGRPAGPLPEGSPPRAIPRAVAATAFDMISPAPTRFHFKYGYALWPEGGTDVLGVHPDCDLWVPVLARAKRIDWEFGLFPEAYEREGDKTNGVEFLIEGETPDGQRRHIWRRLLDPAAVPADRGRQHEKISIQVRPGETLVFCTRANANASYDWAYLARIEVK